MTKFYRRLWTSLLILAGSSFIASMTIAALTGEGLYNNYSFWCIISSGILILSWIYPFIKDIQISKEQDRTQAVKNANVKLQREVPDEQLLEINKRRK